jgi:hypothetical protein
MPDWITIIAPAACDARQRSWRRLIPQAHPSPDDLKPWNMFT